MLSVYLQSNSNNKKRNKMRTENQKMKTFLAENGINATPKFIWDGSLKGTWRIYNYKIDWFNNVELQNKMTALGFTDHQGEQLNKFSGSGVFQIFARFNQTPAFIESDRFNAYLNIK